MLYSRGVLHRSRRFCRHPTPYSRHPFRGVSMTGTAHGGHSRHVSFERERGVYQILVTPDLAHVVVTVGADSERSSRVLRVFRTLADENIPLFLIKLHRTAVSFVVEIAHV